MLLKAAVMSREIPCAQCVRPEALLAAQNHALELIAGDDPLGEILDFLTRIIEGQAEPGLFCSVLVVDGERLSLAAGPTLPAAFAARAVDVPIGPLMGCCGAAAFTGERVVARDIRTDPRWTPHPEITRLALDSGLAACWSTPIRDPAGAVLGTFAVYYPEPRDPRAGDLHLVEIATHLAGIAIERHHARRTLEERAQRLAEADRRKDEFLALLAHELRIPLAPMVTALDRLHRSPHDHGLADRCFRVVDRQVRQLTRLVDDLLDVSRITRGKIVLQRERTPLRAALACALDSASPLLERRGHHLSVQIADEPLGLDLDADPVRLAQILSNVLNNAAKYTEAGGHLEVAAAREGDEVVITVRDDGMGIPADMLAAVFDLFVQTDAARGQAQGGLGIGLTLVRRLVEMHGGTITAASEGAGKGSTFTLRLPAAPEAAVAAPPPGSARLSPRRRVLVVDDNIDAADCLADALRDAGHEVRVENDGLAALASTTSWLPDVALIDIGMPGIDGYEVARRLRAAHPRARLRLVALTGFGQEGDLLLAQVAGFDVHLVKPANLERITAALAG